MESKNKKEKTMGRNLAGCESGRAVVTAQTRQVLGHVRPCLHLHWMYSYNNHLSGTQPGPTVRIHQDWGLDPAAQRSTVHRDRLRQSCLPPRWYPVEEIYVNFSNPPVNSPSCEEIVITYQKDLPLNPLDIFRERPSPATYFNCLTFLGSSVY